MGYARARIVWFALVVLLSGGWVVGAGTVAMGFIEAAPPKGGEPNSRLPLTTAIMEVARTNLPAVVQINVTQRQEVPNPFFSFGDNPFFRQFFDLPKNMPKKFEQELKALGSGMIIDDSGYILTNNHVVAGANEIEVLLADGRQFKATVKGTDPKTDLGVIKINADAALPKVTFGNSDAVEVGQWVVAIGHPRGLDQTVTQGIISAKHRTGITDPNDYQDFLQTDAAINPGNSGGPLINLDGQVIGINSSILSQSGGFEGIGFAIPSNMAIHVAKALIEKGKVERGWLGVSVQDLTPELAKSFGLQSPQGALVAEIAKDGPADRAGMRRGDVIMDIAGRPVRDAASLRNEVADTTIGSEVTFTIWRGKERKELRVAIGNLEEQAKAEITAIKKRLGAVLVPVSPVESNRYNLNGKGMVIQWIDPNGPLGRAGLEKDDIILEIDQNPVTTISDLVTILDSLGAKREIQLLVVDHRNGQMGYVKARVE